MPAASSSCAVRERSLLSHAAVARIACSKLTLPNWRGSSLATQSAICPNCRRTLSSRTIDHNSSPRAKASTAQGSGAETSVVTAFPEKEGLPVAAPSAASAAPGNSETGSARPSRINHRLAADESHALNRADLSSAKAPKRSLATTATNAFTSCALSAFRAIFFAAFSAKFENCDDVGISDLPDEKKGAVPIVALKGHQA